MWFTCLPNTATYKYVMFSDVTTSVIFVAMALGVAPNGCLTCPAAVDDWTDGNRVA